MLIINGEVHSMAGPVIKNGFVKTEGNKISRVGAMCEIEGQTFDDEVIDVHGAWVMPGMIEAHGHIGISEEKQGVIGDDCNETSNPVLPYLRAIDAVNPMDAAFHEAVMAGITSVMTGPGSANVVGGQFLFMKTHGRCLDEMVVLAPAAMKAAFGENPKTNFGDNGKCPVTRMAIAALLRQELFKASRYKVKKDRGDLEAEDFTLEPWLPVLRREIPIKAHVHRADDILTAIRIAREFQVDITLDHCTEGHLIAGEIARSGFPAIVGSDLTSRSKLEVQNMNFKTNHVLYDAGILIAITTDHPVSLIQYLPICAGMAVKRGLPVEEGLKAITINAAKICRVEHRVGSLQAGKDADIAIFTGNPMETFTETLCTIINGEIVYKFSLFTR